MINNKKAFTLIEIMVGIIIVSMVIIGGFQALTAVTIGKARLIVQTNIQKESFYFTEKLFEIIKKGGTIDYEEYFNRKIIGNTTYSSGHFLVESGFGNFGSGSTIPGTSYGDLFYYCRSGNGFSNKMTGTGCVSDYNGGVDYSGKQQRYGQYSFQFIDYNSNYDSDGGDEDGDLNIIGDDDDEYLGEGPSVFNVGENLKELYIISGDKKVRTLLRWNIKRDTNAPSGNDCTFDSNTYMPTATGGCLGTIEYLKLNGKDWGMNHDLSGNKSYDGVIDTWVIDSNLTGNIGEVAGTGSINWIPLFPESINVTQFEIFAYPNIDINKAWKSSDKSINISPYVELKIKLKPSWNSRKKINGEGKELDFSMTINLSEMYSN